MRLTSLAFIGFALFATPACGPATRNIRPTSPFTAEMGRLFDDSVDYVQNIEALGGHLAEDWGTQIDGLSRGSDLMAVAQIETVLQGQDSQGARIYRLTANMTDIVRGEAPADRHVQLRVSEGQAGFNTVAGKEDRLQRGRYMVFVKWYTDGAGEVQAHWHLTPYTDELLARVRRTSGVEAQQIGAERVTRRDRGNQ